MEKVKSRWYDQDPLLKSIMEFLEVAPVDMRVCVAMDLMQMIIQENYIAHDGLVEFTKNNYTGNCQRWYDANEVTHSAIEMLKLLDEKERKGILLELTETIRYFALELGERNERLVTGDGYLPDKQD